MSMMVVKQTVQLEPLAESAEVKAGLMESVGRDDVRRNRTTMIRTIRERRR